MDRPLDLLEEYDLTPEERRDKRRAEFDRWFKKPQVRLYEAVMLSVRIIPQPQYRLKKPIPTSHPPRYPDEFFFSFAVDRSDFDDRMVPAVNAIRKKHLKGVPDARSGNESEYLVSLAEFERWAMKSKLQLPQEWRQSSDVSSYKGSRPSRREQNTLLRIIRALMRALHAQDEESLWSFVERALLVVPIDRPTVTRAHHGLRLADRRQEAMSPDEKKIVQQTPDPGELKRIIAALVYGDKSIDLRRKGGVKRISRYAAEDHDARGIESAIVPGDDTIEQVLQKVREILAEGGADNPS